MSVDIRQNFTKEVEKAINEQINIELDASYTYLSMGIYFSRPDVALANISKWMLKQSCEEREHAIHLMKYQNMRGGRVILSSVDKPGKDDWGTALEAFEFALEVEKNNNKALLKLHTIGEKNNDAQLTDYLEDKFLREQVESIEEIGKIITNLKRVGTGLGEYVFDREHFE